MTGPSNARRYWFWLLALPYAATLYPGFYARSEPALFGMPFFYWYQLLWVALSGPCIAIVYLMTRRAGR